MHSLKNMSERLSKGLPFKSDVTFSAKQTIKAYQRLTFQIRLYTLQNRPERLIKGLPFKSNYTLSAKQTRKAYQRPLIPLDNIKSDFNAIANKLYII